MKKLYILIVALFFSYAVSAQPPTLSWVNSIGGSSNEVVYGMCSDPSGNVYVAGSYEGTVDFDPGSGDATRISTSGSTNGYLVKFNSAGIFQWVVTIDGSDNSAVGSVAADATGVYVTGYFNNTADFNPFGIELRTATGGTGLDIFIARYLGSNGSLSFVNSIGSNGTDLGTSIALDASSNIYVAGGFRGTVDFDPTANDASLTAWSPTIFDMFLAKYSSSGAFIWADDIGSDDGEDVANAVATDGTSVFIGGRYDGSFLHADPYDDGVGVSNSGGIDGYYGRYRASDGALLIGGTIRSPGEDQVTAIAVDKDNFYVGGYYTGTGSLFGNSGTTKSLASNGATDGFVAQFRLSDMNLQWANVVGGTNNDYIVALITDGGSVYATGSFASESMDVDPAQSIIYNLESAGDYDAFVVKYNHVSGSLVPFPFSIGGANADLGKCLTISGGYLYWAGGYVETLDMDPGSSVTFKTSASPTAYDVYVSKFAPVEPLSSAESLSFSPVGATTFDVNFTPASNLPDGYVTIARVGALTTDSPVDGIQYSSNADIGNSFVLHNGPEISYNYSGALPSSFYSIAIYAYNGYGTATNYRLVDPLTGTVNTIALASEPGGAPTNFGSSDVTATSYTVTFNASTPSSGGYIAVRGTAASLPNFLPADGITYTAGQALGPGTVAFIGGLSATAGAQVQFTETNLTPDEQYVYRIYAFNGTTGNINYNTGVPLTGNVTTLPVAEEPTDQPTDLQFSGVTASGFSFNFTASIGSNVTGYIGIRSAGSAPTFVPTDGIEYAGGATVDETNDQVVSFTGTGTNWGYTEGIDPNTTYYFRIYAYNGSGTGINYLQVNPLSGNVTTLDEVSDITGPDIEDNTVTSTAGNVAITVTADITDDETDISNASIEYYPINAIEYGFQDMVFVSEDADTWEATIPASANTEQGVEYRIHAFDEAGNETITPWTSVVVEYGDSQMTIPYSAGNTQANYRIISVPLNLTKKSVADVFGDDLGDYNKSKYRLFSYSANGTSELAGSSSIELGKGYWFIAAESKTIDTGAGSTALAGVDHPVNVRVVNGWNLIGNPFITSVDAATVATHEDNSDKTFGDFKTYEGSFVTATQLKPMSGGFVMIQAAGNGQLRIPAYSTGRISAPSPVNFKQAIASGTWSVDLLVKSGSFTNSFAGFGMHPDASEQNDKYDDFTLPRFLDYLELNYNKQLYGSAFTKDIVPTSPQHVWEFEVESNLSDEVIEMTWDNAYFGNTDQELVLWDVGQQRAIDMKTDNRYSFERSLSRSFRVLFGSPEFVSKETQPFRPVFHSVSPVPSAGNVTFAFSVPESGGQVKTSLVIYNMMGQKVADLVDGALPAGYQQAQWNIEDSAKPAAGVYISVLKFGETTLQKRLIIK